MESGIVVYVCDLCEFQTRQPDQAQQHMAWMNKGVRNPQWKHEIMVKAVPSGETWPK